MAVAAPASRRAFTGVTGQLYSRLLLLLLLRSALPLGFLLLLPLCAAVLLLCLWRCNRMQIPLILWIRLLPMAKGRGHRSRGWLGGRRTRHCCGVPAMHAIRL